MLYLVTLLVFILSYIAFMFLVKYMKNKSFWNIAFTISIYLLYVCLVLKVYGDVGFEDWNFRNTLPVANVSPFMFSIVPLIHIFPKKIKRYFYLLISLLTVGMFLSSVFGCLYNFSISYKFHPHFLLDYVAHILISMWGVYIVKSEQVSVKKKDCIISSSIITSVAFVMMILNVIFDTSFFGLSLNGKHNIYNNVLVKNSYLSAALYFIGLIFVLLMGWIFLQIINRKNTQQKQNGV